MTDNNPNYLEWLQVAINSRLIFNTLDEYSTFFDDKNIVSNSIKHCFNTEFKQCDAFKKLELKVHDLTDSDINFEEFMVRYKNSSEFYKSHLSRKSNPEEIAEKMLIGYYAMCRYDYSAKVAGAMSKDDNIFYPIFDLIYERRERQIDINMIVLLMLKIMPCYNARKGDNKNLAEDYNGIIKRLKCLTSDALMYDVLPEIAAAESESERNKSLLTLWWHMDKIFDAYWSCRSTDEFFDMVSLMKENRENCDISGFWISNGVTGSTSFWRIEKTCLCGAFYAVHYGKKDCGKLLKTQYFVQIFIGEDDFSYEIQVAAPSAIRQMVSGQKSREGYMRYTLNGNDSLFDIKVMNLSRAIKNLNWPKNVRFTKVDDENIANEYHKWIENYRVEDEFKDFAYELGFGLAAITRSAVYIDAEKEGLYYRVPIGLRNKMTKLNLEPEIRKIKTKGETYLAFAEFNLYIPLSEMDKYGVTIVNSIS